MKVLWLDHPEACFLGGALYMGLCEVLGADNVVDHPHKPSLHGQRHVYPRPWHNGQEGTTDPMCWQVASPARAWSDAEVRDRIGEFDVVVVASPRPVAVDTAKSLVSTLGRDRLRNLVLVDGEDYGQVRWDVIEELKLRVCFKRELLHDPPILYPQAMTRMAGQVRLVPFPFCSPIPARPPAWVKDIDVLFVGGNSWSGRAAVAEALSRELGPRFVGGYLGYDAYLDAINRAKIAVSVRGHGMDTLRYVEIPSFETLLLADRLPLIRHHAFEDGVHASYFGSPEELLVKVRHYLANEEDRARVARAGNERLRMHHTAAARARQLLGEALS